MYDTILFDLDGTLTDPGLGITNSVAYALKKWGIDVSNRSELYKYIGPPLIESFEKFCGFTHDDAVLALKYYREYFSVKGLFENEVYSGIVDVLDKLKLQGKRLIVATSKPEIYSEKILKHFDLYGYFDFLAGATFDETRVKKNDVIEYAIKSCGIKDMSSVVMIGDRKHDVEGALCFGIDSIGVLWGYGGREELETAGATYIAEKVEDILNIVN